MTRGEIMAISQSFWFATEIFGVLFVTVVLCWYAYFKYCFTYWEKKGLPTVPPVFPGGNINAPLLGRISLFVQLQNMFSDFKAKGYKHAGLYFLNGPIYFPIAPELVKRILTTDFEHFVDRGTYLRDKDILTGHLFSLEGAKWKNLRTKLSPVFTSGKLKSMYDLIFMKTTKNLVQTMEPLAERGDEINAKKILDSFTADIIFSTAFGLETNSLANPNSRIRMVTARLFNPPFWSSLKCILEGNLQNPGNILKATHTNKFIEDFFKKIVGDTIKHRTQNNVKRNDFFSLLLDIRDKEGLTFEEIVAQCYLFFLAGYETSSSTMASALHELAHNPQLQDRLRQELYEKLGKDYTKYSYDDLLQLPYLDKVVKETLRLYPVVGFLNRICVKTYRVPESDVVIDVGTPVLISTLGLQRDKDFFPDPIKFDPERFERKDSVTPYTYLPFGEGPRVCIGTRYGQLQTKLGIAALISQFKFSPSPKTPKVIEFDKLSTSLTLSRKEGMFLRVSKL